MQKSLLFRGFAIGGLIIILLIALSSVQGIVYERQARSLEVQQDIARSAAGAQSVNGPVLVLPFERTVHNQWTDPATGETRRSASTEKGSLHMLPDVLRVQGTLRTELRQRGIFSTRVYRTLLQVEGHFRIPAHFAISGPIEEFTFGDAVFAVGVADVRGIVGSLALDMQDRHLTFEPGSGSDALGAGIHATFDLPAPATETEIPFRFTLELAGTDALQLVPAGRSTEVSLDADWPHPSFVGDFLPLERTVSDAGFSAQWKTTSIATGLEALFDQCFRTRENCDAVSGRNLGVSLINPVDHYALSERSMKYGLLFIVLTFAGFFLFEVLKSVRVHPVQYGFVGAGLVVFYLLLLSLSEHLGFAPAYLLSSLACITLIGGYARSVLGNTARAVGFVAALAALYGALYCVLNAEDYALLMGSALLFAVLAVAMVLTRKVDWFRWGASDPARAPV